MASEEVSADDLKLDELDVGELHMIAEALRLYAARQRLHAIECRALGGDEETDRAAEVVRINGQLAGRADHLAGRIDRAMRARMRSWSRRPETGRRGGRHRGQE